MPCHLSGSGRSDLVAIHSRLDQQRQLAALVSRTQSPRRPRCRRRRAAGPTLAKSSAARWIDVDVGAGDRRSRRAAGTNTPVLPPHIRAWPTARPATRHHAIDGDAAVSMALSAGVRAAGYRLLRAAWSARTLCVDLRARPGGRCHCVMGRSPACSARWLWARRSSMMRSRVGAGTVGRAATTWRRHHTRSGRGYHAEHEAPPRDRVPDSPFVLRGRPRRRP